MFELFDLPKIFLSERLVKAREQIDSQYRREYLYSYYISTKYLYLYRKLWHKNNIVLAILHVVKFMFENNRPLLHVSYM